MKILEEVFSPSYAQTPVQGCMDHEKLGKHDTPKGTDKAWVTEPKEMEVCDLPQKDFKTVILKKLNEM